MSLVGPVALVTMVTGSLKTLSSAVEEVRLVRGVGVSDMYDVLMSPNDGMSLLRPELTSVTSTRSEVTAEEVERMGRIPPSTQRERDKSC